MRTQGITRTRKMAGIDSARVFEKAKSQGLDCFYLETSVGINESLSTTVIGFGPFKTLRNFSNKTEISFRDQVDISEEPFFSILDREVNKLQVRQDSGSQSEFEKNGGICRFQNGGIFGCIGYECVSEIEPRLLKFGTFKSNSCASKDSSASLPRAQLMICYKLIVFEAKMDLIYSIDATGARDSTCLPLFDQLLDSEEAPPPHKQGTMEFDTRNLDLPKDSLESGFGDVEFSKKVGEIKAHIRAGDIFQAVLSERFTYHLKTKPMAIFQKLRELSPAPYSFYFDFGDRVLLGASPEMLVRVEARKVSTNPIAGTRPRGRNSAEDQRQTRNLVRSPKEGAEHLMLVDLARNDLGRVANPGSVRVSRFRQLRKLSNVIHLVSQVDAELRDGVTALDALKAAFPAGTLSGAPKIRAMEILAELENEARGFYGGAVVAFDGAGGLDSCIAIRCLEVRGQLGILRAGAGLVMDSKPESEYAEIKNKLKTLRVAIAATEILNNRGVS